MHITSLAKLSLAGLLLVAGSVSANDVYNWKNNKGTSSYSDVPPNLKYGQTQRVNVRTSTSTPAAPAVTAASKEGSLIEQQAKLNEQINAQNKEIDEQNEKIKEQNKQQREDNCKTAKLNRSFAESARTANRAELISRDDQDSTNYCK